MLRDAGDVGGAGMLRGCGDCGSPLYRAQRAAVQVRGVPWDAPRRAGGFKPRRRLPTAGRAGGGYPDRGAALAPRRLYSQSRYGNPQAVFCAQNSLHFAHLICAVARTLCLTLWGEPVAGVWSLRARSARRTFRRCSRGSGCGVGVRREQGFVTRALGSHTSAFCRSVLDGSTSLLPSLAGKALRKLGQH